MYLVEMFEKVVELGQNDRISTPTQASVVAIADALSLCMFNPDRISVAPDGAVLFAFDSEIRGKVAYGLLLIKEDDLTWTCTYPASPTFKMGGECKVSDASAMLGSLTTMQFGLKKYTS